MRPNKPLPTFLACLAGCILILTSLSFAGCKKKDNGDCGDDVCEGSEDATNCPEDCGCGNEIVNVQMGEECDTNNFNGLTCLDYNCAIGTLACDQNCRIQTNFCEDCDTCGDGVKDGTDECDCGEDPNDLPPDCTDINGGTNANCTAECDCMNTCGDGTVELCETCDCGSDPNNLPVGCTHVNGDPDSTCTGDCQEPTCEGGPFDDCNPTNPDACCDDTRPNCNLDGYCESSAFTTPLCMMACGATSECYYNSLCHSQYGMCYPATCGSGENTQLGGQVNEPCQVPQANAGWCLPLSLAKDQRGVCVEQGTVAHGEDCTDYEYIDLTKMCRDDAATLVCASGICSNNDFTCRNFCDPDEVYTSGVDNCPAGYNCWNYSNINDTDPNDPDQGCRSSDFGICTADDVTDPQGGLTSCDLTNGELIGNRAQTCANLDPDWECVLVRYTDDALSWGSRIGSCADTMQSPFLNIWEVCDGNTQCPPGSVCMEEDVFAPNPQGQTRCIPYCDTENQTLCSHQHAQLPIDNVCTSASYLFAGLNCTEEDFSKLGLCGCQAGGCGIGLCGNGVIDGTETCDGTEVGIHTCQYYGLGTGVMGCAVTCDATDPSNC